MLMSSPRCLWNRMCRGSSCPYLRILTSVLVILTISYNAYWNHPESENETHMKESLEGPAQYVPIQCRRGNDSTVNCVKIGREIFLPFSLIEKSYRIHGKMSRSDSEVFEFEDDHFRVNDRKGDPESPDSESEPAYLPITCRIDQNSTIACVKLGTEVFVPFSMVEKDYDAIGQFSKLHGSEIFDFNHSKGNIHPPVEKYHAMGIHLDDVYAFVEGRPWVIFVDGRQGVPLCRQWFPDGFFFSTNIAQFGLSHYSKYYQETPPEHQVLDAGGASHSQWAIGAEDGTVYQNRDLAYSKLTNVLTFKTSETEPQSGAMMTFDKDISRKILEKKLFHFSMHFRFHADSSITFHVHKKSDNTTYQLHYVCNDTSLEAFGDHVIIGIGKRNEWGSLTRNLFLDLEQGVNRKLRINNARIHLTGKYIDYISGIELRGTGDILNLTLTSEAHLEHFRAAAEWVLDNQDDHGGWPMPVERPLGTDVLQPGWYSALGQGVCMSLLARAYGFTKDDRYLNAAIKATRLFHIPSADGGVKAMFMDRHVWYEEYPTNPPSFVLNGYMIALFGLYDLMTSAPSPRHIDAKKLFDDGMKSLKVLLPLFDSGSRTLYDLRHLTMLTTPNVCRWGYHNLHVLLLQHLATIDSDPIFKTFGDRWLKYKTGYRSPTN